VNNAESRLGETFHQARHSGGCHPSCVALRSFWTGNEAGRPRPMGRALQQTLRDDGATSRGACT
jgi:hypothetical protein